MVNPNNLERPRRPQQNNQSTSQSPQPPQRRHGQGGGQPPRNQGGGGNYGNNNQPPSPWLNPANVPNPNPSASFVEYLRWMRPADHQHKDATKTQILQMATEKANYGDRLKILNQRTELIAGKANTFEVICPWRIRVGGHRGPESILLPAFDALGIPFIPSSTLRGVARTQAIREVMATKNCKWETAEKDPLVVRHFGSLDADKKDQAGKIVFFDAYPIAGKFNLEMDIANNIWTWEGTDLKYAPNPNAFLSLNKTSFLIGLKLVASETDQQLLKQVQDWLISGLANGAGSQINTGYGQLLAKNPPKPKREFLRLQFALEGQLIHGYQKFTQWQQNANNGNWQMRGQAQAEVRPTAFKSMLRYWFRVFALGVIPLQDVQTWEGKIFGAISPTQEYGYLTVNIKEGKVTRREARPSQQGRSDPSGEMEGLLTFSLSTAAPQNSQSLEDLIQNLTWLMFNLGGVGQGARRPCYSRKNSASQRAPWWRGSTLFLGSDPWGDPEDQSAQDFAKLFKRRLRSFYISLAQITQRDINPQKLQNCGQVNQRTWQQAADINCRIVIASGRGEFGKSFALAQLHHQRFKVNGHYDGNLCGQVQGGVKPSPVWILDLDEYQVVTIFGATASPRCDYLQSLNQAIQVFPLQ